ncbi:hypothetical protein HMPREF0554_2372 [Pseudoleptotrichia goodfellowii F0264]|uniref:Uncharacterized protein n=1 Tax=Pseudoleptotrichia goodfellowii F0264 TaxID=596323 RepID=D0GNT9_9FUSO|nr:hypothetical protein HMPREF0554_2372 [Pseudoleptotrichia goodfellowii F0264]
MKIQKFNKFCSAKLKLNNRNKGTFFKNRNNICFESSF